jgi:ribosomal protein S18 acetylase RimI-like enzyme
MSLYKQYLKEREDLEVLENPYGFISFKFDEENKSCFIQDWYVKPEYRVKGVGHKLADLVDQIANKKGIKTMIGQVDTWAPEPTRNIKAVMAHGYKILDILDNRIIRLYKEL